MSCWLRRRLALLVPALNNSASNGGQTGLDGISIRLCAFITQRRLAGDACRNAVRADSSGSRRAVRRNAGVADGSTRLTQAAVILLRAGARSGSAVA